MGKNWWQEIAVKNRNYWWFIFFWIIITIGLLIWAWISMSNKSKYNDILKKAESIVINPDSDEEHCLERLKEKVSIWPVTNITHNDPAEGINTVAWWVRDSWKEKEVYFKCIPNTDWVSGKHHHWFIWILYDWDIIDNDISSISESSEESIWNTENTGKLTESYNKHKNYVRNACKEWVKLISNNQNHNFEWPTYAGEYLWKFIIKWTDNWVLFRCELISSDNEWWMNISNVEWEI